MRMILYAPTLMPEFGGLRVLEAPLSRGMTTVGLDPNVAFAIQPHKPRAPSGMRRRDT
jgi:hypothetical protein